MCARCPFSFFLTLSASVWVCSFACVYFLLYSTAGMCVLPVNFLIFLFHSFQPSSILQIHFASYVRSSAHKNRSDRFCRIHSHTLCSVWACSSSSRSLCFIHTLRDSSWTNLERSEDDQLQNCFTLPHREHAYMYVCYLSFFIIHTVAGTFSYK